MEGPAQAFSAAAHSQVVVDLHIHSSLYRYQVVAVVEGVVVAGVVRIRRCALVVAGNCLEGREVCLD